MFASGNGPIQVQYFADAVFSYIKRFHENDRIESIRSTWSWMQVSFRPNETPTTYFIKVEAKSDTSGIYFVINPPFGLLTCKTVRVGDSRDLLALDVDNIHGSDVQRWIEQNMDLDAVVEDITEHIDWMIENY